MGLQFLGILYDTACSFYLSVTGYNGKSYSVQITLLQRYESERKAANITMMAILDGFQKAYSIDFMPINVLRALAFNGAQYISPLKRKIISYASGNQMLPLFT